MNRIFSTEDPFVKNALLDFRIHEGNGNVSIANIRGEGKFSSSAFPEYSQPQRKQRVLVEFIEPSSWRRALPPLWKRWLTAIRPGYLLFSLLPILLVFSVYHQQTRSPAYLPTFLLWAAAVLVHVACILWSDYEDHLRQIDSAESSGGSGVVQKLWIPAVHLRNVAAVLLVAGVAAGLWLLTEMPGSTARYLLGVGAVGVLVAASFSGWPFHYKYFGLGEPLIFLLAGPIVAFAASLVYFQEPSFYLWFALASLPLSFLAVLRLHAGNMQRIPFDSAAGAVTLAQRLGFPRSRWVFVGLLLSPYVATGALIFFGVVKSYALLAFLTLPLCLFPLHTVVRCAGPLDPKCAELRSGALKIHFAFGVVYSLSFLV